MTAPGKTTKQLIDAPRNSIYVWVNGKLDYPRRLARQLGRYDIKIVSPSIFENKQLRATNKPIVLDHAVNLTFEQFHEYFVYANRVDKVQRADAA